MMEFVCTENELILNIPFKVNLKGIDIIVCKTSTGIYALLDKCSHEEYPLSDGIVEDEKITCAKHGSRFSLQDGSPKNLPALLPVKTYKVRLEGENVFVLMD